MGKIKFNVSARTARLIGRENVSNPNGALIELIKNCHDADASEALLIFDIKYDAVPEHLKADDFIKLRSEFDNISKFYSKQNNGEYKLRSSEIVAGSELERFFKGLNSIYLIDNGHGMTSKTIEDHWMTIGTDNKLEDPLSPTGRIKSGAKGIGRFALDRLGSECEVYTYAIENSKKGLLWSVDWNDFEKPNKKIDEISAELNKLEDFTYEELLDKEIFSQYKLNGYEKVKYKRGSLIHVKSVRDWWRTKDIRNAFENLESLIPPQFQNAFSIYIHDSRENDQYGYIKSSDVSDYDYKVEASVLKSQKVKIKLYRNEFDYKKFPEQFFRLESLKDGPFKKKDFEKEYIEFEYSFKELFNSSRISEQIFDKVGAFEMTFLYMKKSFTQKDTEKFYYHTFDSALRRERLNLFGGIKIYRDNFKVRPYGCRIS